MISHAESAEFESHAENAESESHAESAESAEFESRAENAGASEPDPGATPSSRMGEGALPKGWRPGCGCLCLLLPYYLFGLSLVDHFRWEHDWPSFLAYVLVPFLWPVLLAGWMPHPVLKIPVALAAVFAYWYWIRAAWKADDLKWTFLNLLWIVLLFLASIGGCAMEFDRSFKF